MSKPSEQEASMTQEQLDLPRLRVSTYAPGDNVLSNETLSALLDLAESAGRIPELEASCREQFEVASHNAKAYSELRERNGRLCEAVNGYRQVAAQDKHRAEAADARVKALELACQEAIDLLLERIHHNPARSAAHNARLTLQAALSPAQSTEGEA